MTQKNIFQLMLVFLVMTTVTVCAPRSWANGANEAEAVVPESSVIEAEPDWEYASVRRLMIYIETSLRLNLQWTVFEEDTDSLRAAINRDVWSFLEQLWAQGALFGATPAEAFWVDLEASPEDVQQGRLILLMGIAPVQAGEFVGMRMVLKVGG